MSQRILQKPSENTNVGFGATSTGIIDAVHVNAVINTINESKHTYNKYSAKQGKCLREFYTMCPQFCIHMLCVMSASYVGAPGDLTNAIGAPC